MTIADELKEIAGCVGELPLEIRVHVQRELEDKLLAIANRLEGRVAVKPDTHYDDEAPSHEAFSAKVYSRGAWMYGEHRQSKAEAVAALQDALDMQAKSG